MKNFLSVLIKILLPAVLLAAICLCFYKWQQNLAEAALLAEQEYAQETAPSPEPEPSPEPTPDPYAEYIHRDFLRREDAPGDAAAETGDAVNSVAVIKFSNGGAAQEHLYRSVTVTVEDIYGNTVLEDANALWKRHGNTTLRTSKSPYRFKLSENTDLLGLGKAHNFILLANAMDKTLMRNTVALYLGHSLGLPYTSEFCYADVYVDGAYKGNYLLVEPVSAYSSRVDINPSQHEYLIEINRRDYFQYVTPVCNFSLSVKVPERLSKEESDWLNGFFSEAETALKEEDTDKIFSLFDIDSFVDCYIIYELTKNYDTNRFSTYFYIQNGVLHSGPIWDFDLSCGNIMTDTAFDGWVSKGSWWELMFNLEPVKELFAARYRELQPVIVNLYEDNALGTNYLDTVAEMYRESFDLNYTIHDIGKPAYNIEIYPYKTYGENLEFLRTWLRDRNEWILAQLPALTE